MGGRGRGVEGENGNGKMPDFSYDAFERSSGNVRFLVGLESNTFLKVAAEASLTLPYQFLSLPYL